jgi:ketosteroid isomerase-like protein
MKYILIKRFIYSGVLVFLLHSKLYAQQEISLLEEIKAINREMAQALIQGDSKKSLSYYADDVISIPNKSEIMIGIDMIRRANAVMIAYGIKVNRFDVITMEAFSCDNLVMEMGYYQIAMIAPGMTRETGENGKYITIWERQADGQLKIKVELWNTVNPEKIPSHL